MLVVCKDNKFCIFNKTCEHSKVHESRSKCTQKNSHCLDGCRCSNDNVFKFLRKEKLEKIEKLCKLEIKYFV